MFVYSELYIFSLYFFPDVNLSRYCFERIVYLGYEIAHRDFAFLGYFFNTVIDQEIFQSFLVFKREVNGIRINFADDLPEKLDDISIKLLGFSVCCSFSR